MVAPCIMRFKTKFHVSGQNSRITFIEFLLSLAVMFTFLRLFCIISFTIKQRDEGYLCVNIALSLKSNSQFHTKKKIIHKKSPPLIKSNYLLDCHSTHINISTKRSHYTNHQIIFIEMSHKN